ncbi:ATP-binding cassette sub-family G member 5 isoform X2 [Ostrinia furnacalis]|uniref:ATP-binding cassette sub-family G member 5 isoform X2 n=1 Tax=Ostrinia furnacalis TaxID=93504 RepID=UPI00103CCA25|nr:ATP-binding cassette sub-family G member 5 isoform X2 [Ostrinia furnacalis]
MLATEYTLELCNVFHSGQVEPGSFFQRLTGGVKTGVILKDVSFTTHSGEVTAILGSKGSGKRALLDVIARRVPSKGHILLDGVPLEEEQLNNTCALVRHSTKLLPGLTVQQTLSFSLTKIEGYLKSSKVKQVMADLALSQVANKSVTNLTKSEYRRLVIGVQLIRDPIILLLDEPTWDLDPLSTYLVISILSNAAKKYGTAIILTMEKPRSDVFPFLERVVYLCLGDAVYAGPTRNLLDYFGSIGFPCPQLENPLMYYLCLSTVDRRSRERFIESNHQIAALVEKFKLEGQGIMQGHMTEHSRIVNPNKQYGKPGGVQVIWMLYVRMLVSIFNFRKNGLKQMFMRLFTLPLYFLILWLFYNEAKDYQRAFITKSGLIFNAMVGTYFVSIMNTICLYGPYRTRYYQESQEGLYSGASLLLSWNLVSLPFSFISTFASAAIIYNILGDITENLDFIYFALVLWSCYVFAEQQAIAVMMVVKRGLIAAVVNIYITCVYVMLASGVLRSYKGYEDWLYYVTYITHTRYASIFMHRSIFKQPRFNILPYNDQENCTSITSLIQTSSSLNTNSNANCRYASGKAFLTERFTARNYAGDIYTSGDFNLEFNLGISFAFSVGIMVLNKFLYLIPLPSYITDKFRE